MLLLLLLWSFVCRVLLFPSESVRHLSRAGHSCSLHIPWQQRSSIDGPQHYMAMAVLACRVCIAAAHRHCQALCWGITAAISQPLSSQLLHGVAAIRAGEQYLLPSCTV